MDIKTKNLLNEYMDVLFRITIAEHWFNRLNNKKTHGKGSKEYDDFCNLLYRMRDLYIDLRELNVNPPRWTNDNKDLDKKIERYKNSIVLKEYEDVFPW